MDGTENKPQPPPRPQADYTCSACGLGVIILPAGKMRICDHHEAPIIAHARASLTGTGDLSAASSAQ
jgi:hypothetical protein